ncbi:MAG: hypothetical protein LWY06_18495 [Firmicutes bacterium]|nr:hypothetical protein [Bacillota bacterium]
MNIGQKLQEQGVGLCIIETDKGSSAVEKGSVIVMLDFWEKDNRQIQKNLDKIKELAKEYIRLNNEEMQAKLVKFVTPDGFNIDDVIAGRVEMQPGNQDSEYLYNVEKFNSKLEENLWKALEEAGFQKTDMQIKFISDVAYDETLDKFSVNKLYFFARFNNLDSEKRQNIRIIFKRISDFNPDRGDRIFFKNVSSEEFLLIKLMSRYIKQTQRSEAVVRMDEISDK